MSLKDFFLLFIKQVKSTSTFKQKDWCNNIREHFFFIENVSLAQFSWNEYGKILINFVFPHHATDLAALFNSKYKLKKHQYNFVFKVSNIQPPVTCALYCQKFPALRPLSCVILKLLEFPESSILIRHHKIKLK